MAVAREAARRTPLGFSGVVVVVAGEKLAVSVPGPFIVAVVGFPVLLATETPPLVTHPAKLYPGGGVADTGTVPPL